MKLHQSAFIRRHIPHRADRRSVMQSYETLPLPCSLEEQMAYLRHIAGNSADLLIDPVVIGGIPCAVAACEGMVSTAVLGQLLIEPLTKLPQQPDTDTLRQVIQTKMLLSLDRPVIREFGTLFKLLHSGFAVLLIEGQTLALGFGMQGYEKRSVTEPSGEANIMGAHEGFTEALRPNLSLLRRRMKTPLLRYEMLNMGTLSHTDVALCWMSDRVPPDLLRRVREALSSADLETVITPGYLQPFLEEQSGGLFDTVSSTERPDVLAAKLLEGRIAVLMDGSPFALVVPKLFNESFQTLDDYSFKPFYATFLRWVKYFAFLLTLLLPALYVAVSVHHPELLNRTLLLLLTKAEADEPLSLPAEAIGVLIMYEVIREAGLRLPKVVGGAVSIVGGLIIGDAAVSSGLISTPMLTVTAIAVTAGFIVPDLNPSLTVLRLVFIAAGGLWGLFGIGLLGMGLLFHLCSAESFGFPVTAPFSPFYPQAMRDVLTRIGIRKMQHGGFTVEQFREPQERSYP